MQIWDFYLNEGSRSGVDFLVQKQSKLFIISLLDDIYRFILKYSNTNFLQPFLPKAFFSIISSWN
jgi:hypothetical protein